MGGCSTPISALAQIKDGTIHFQGNILSPDGKEKVSIEKNIEEGNVANAGQQLAQEILLNGGEKIAQLIRNAK